jgi:hypothetical protein
MLVNTKAEHACGVAFGTNASYWWEVWQNECCSVTLSFIEPVTGVCGILEILCPSYEACSDGKGPIRKKAEYSAKESQLN